MTLPFEDVTVYNQEVINPSTSPSSTGWRGHPPSRPRSSLVWPPSGWWRSICY